MGRIFDRMIAGRIWKHVNKTNAMLTAQHGFRAGLGTGTALRRLKDICDDTHKKWLVGVFADP